MRPGATRFRRAAATRRNSGRVFSRRIAGLMASGGQPLAPLGAATRDHPPTADRGHAGPEAVAALADKHAGLISALHGRYSVNYLAFNCAACISGATGAVNAARRALGFAPWSHTSITTW